MTSAQSRVASLLQIVLRATEAKRQEHPQSLFSPVKVFRRVHGAEKFICGDTAVEGGRQSLKTVCAEHGVQVIFGDWQVGCGVCHGRNRWCE